MQRSVAQHRQAVSPVCPMPGGAKRTRRRGGASTAAAAAATASSNGTAQAVVYTAGGALQVRWRRSSPRARSTLPCIIPSPPPASSVHGGVHRCWQGPAGKGVARPCSQAASWLMCTPGSPTVLEALVPGCLEDVLPGKVRRAGRACALAQHTRTARLSPPCVRRVMADPRVPRALPRAGAGPACSQRRHGPGPGTRRLPPRRQPHQLWDSGGWHRRGVRAGAWAACFRVCLLHAASTHARAPQCAACITAPLLCASHARTRTHSHAHVHARTGR